MRAGLAIVAVIAAASRRSAAHARRGDSRHSTARDIGRAADRSRGSSRLARLSSFSSTRWICRPAAAAKRAGRFGSARAAAIGCARLGDGVHGIEPQAIEAVVAQPVQRILDGEGAHLRHRDSRWRCPRACCASREERRRDSGRDNSPPARSGCRPRRETPSARADARRRSAP